MKKLSDIERTLIANATIAFNDYITKNGIQRPTSYFIKFDKFEPHLKRFRVHIIGDTDVRYEFTFEYRGHHIFSLLYCKSHFIPFIYERESK